MKSNKWLFGSFFLGGFECSSHLTREGARLDLIAATQHDRLARQDYRLCRAAGIRAVRESARWPTLDRRGVLELSSVRELASLGREVGLTQIWDLMHYGYPDDVDPFSGEFVKRLAAFARAVASVVCEETGGPGWYTPVNEISYTAWAGGQVGYMAPFALGRGGEYKRALVKAAIAAANAIWEVDPNAQMLSVDPLIRLHAPSGRPDLVSKADNFNKHVVTEAFDLLAGYLEPELGGSRAHLGVVGLNYYSGNQWTIATPDIPQRFLGWDDPDVVPLSAMLAEVEEKYGGPVVIAETGASADERAAWMAHLTAQILQAREAGLNIQGICLYPVVSSPDWEDTTASFEGGLFDTVPQPNGELKRVCSAPVLAALGEAQKVLDPAIKMSSALPVRDLEPGDSQRREPMHGFARPLQTVRFKPDNFSYRTLAAGEELSLEVYGFEPGYSLPAHRHEHTEHVLTVLSGQGNFRIGNRWINVRAGESIIVPARLYHGIHNYTTERLVVQQVSAPKPWDAHFQGPHPVSLDGGGPPAKSISADEEQGRSPGTEQ